MNKRGQLELSFGLIFSVILIAAFLGFAIYAIISFLGMKDRIQTGQFLNDLQTDVDKLWKASQGSQEVSYILPQKIKEVCFIGKSVAKKGPYQGIYEELKRNSGEQENLVFYPIGSSKPIRAMEIRHLNIEKLIQTENPLCFNNTKGKVKFVLEKGFEETPVNIVR